MTLSFWLALSCSSLEERVFGARATLKYTQLITFSADEYHCKAAKSLDEAVHLVEDGFEFVTDLDGCKLFRKRK